MTQLWNNNSQSTVPLWHDMLNDSDNLLQECARKKLALIEDEQCDLSQILRAMDVQQNIMQKIECTIDEYVTNNEFDIPNFGIEVSNCDDLVTRLTHGDAHQAQFALEELHRMDISQSIAMLSKELTSSNPKTRKGVIEGLGRLKNRKTKKYLIKAIEDPNWANRHLACTYLAQLNDPDSYDALTIGLRDFSTQQEYYRLDWKDRILILNTLIGSNNPKGMKILKRILKEENTNVRDKIASTLLDISRENTIELLEQSLSDSCFMIRYYSVLTLGSKKMDA